MGAQGQGGKRAREGGSTDGAEAGNSVRTAQWDGEAVGRVAGTTVWVRAGLASTRRGEAVWRAGRRSGKMRLRDARLGDGDANTSCGTDVTVTASGGGFRYLLRGVKIVYLQARV